MPVIPAGTRAIAAGGMRMIRVIAGTAAATAARTPTPATGAAQAAPATGTVPMTPATGSPVTGDTVTTAVTACRPPTPPVPRRPPAAGRRPAVTTGGPALACCRPWLPAA